MIAFCVCARFCTIIPCRICTASSGDIIVCFCTVVRVLLHEDECVCYCPTLTPLCIRLLVQRGRERCGGILFRHAPCGYVVEEVSSPDVPGILASFSACPHPVSLEWNKERARGFVLCVKCHISMGDQENVYLADACCRKVCTTGRVLSDHHCERPRH